MKKALNIRVSTTSRDRAYRLAQRCGDGSISSLFERLVEEEFAIGHSSTDASTWSEPSTWKAMLATMPHAEAPFRALVDSPLARAAFREATEPKSSRSKG